MQSFCCHLFFLKYVHTKSLTVSTFGRILWGEGHQAITWSVTSQDNWCQHKGCETKTISSPSNCIQHSKRSLTNQLRVVLEKLIVRSATHEIPRLLWNPKDHYRVHKSPLPGPILSRMNPTHTSNTISLRSLLISSHLCLGLPSGIFPSCFQMHAFIFTMRAACSSHLILLDLITLIIFGEEHKLCRSSLCTSFHPLVNSFLLGQNILLSTLFSNTLNLCSSLNALSQIIVLYTYFNLFVFRCSSLSHRTS
jgi:hypothetical protein